MADGEYHHVEILAVKKNFTLKVDGGLARSIINEGKNEYLGCYVDQILREIKRTRSGPNRPAAAIGGVDFCGYLVYLDS